MATVGPLQNMLSRLSLSSCTGVFGNSNNSTGLLTLVRHASKKSGGSSKNPVGRPRGKHRGIKKFDSTWVSQGTILVRQLGLDFHPGLNVGIGRDRSLYAKEPGIVIMTTEKVNPNWEHPDIMKFYAELKDREDVPIYKTYFHIIADKQHQNFKLVDQI